MTSGTIGCRNTSTASSSLPSARALEAHLAGCAECRTDLAALRAVVTRAESLTDTPPASNLWPGVAARIGAPAAARADDAGDAPVRVHAAAARRRQPGADRRVGRHGLAGADGRPDHRLSARARREVRPANFGDAAFDEAVADLQQTLDAGRGRLDPETIRVLETNLEAIDRAIAQCREALQADPSSVYLNTYLAETRRRKLELLRRATALVDSRS